MASSEVGGECAKRIGMAKSTPINDQEELAAYTINPHSYGGKRSMNVVSHVTHLHWTDKICTDQQLNARRVYDESRLNGADIRVVWLSPNDWGDGFRYGNIQFPYEWGAIVAGRHYYCVETMSYRPTAIRILVSDQEHHDLAPYDPTTNVGPWLHHVDSDEHFFNGHVCVEIMLEADLPLADCLGIQFVNHHPRFCNERSRCPGPLLWGRASSRFIARVIGYDLPFDALKLTRTEDVVIPQPTLARACAALWNELQRKRYLGAIDFEGELNAADDAAVDAGMDVLRELSNDNKGNVRALASESFSSLDDALMGIGRAIAAKLNIPNWQDFSEEYWDLLAYPA